MTNHCEECGSEYCACEPWQRLGMLPAEAAEFFGTRAIWDVHHNMPYSAACDAETAWHCAGDAEAQEQPTTPLTRFVASVVRL